MADNRSPLVSAVSRALSNYRASRLLLGVSGGLDSMVLAEILSRLYSPSELVIAHYNHKTRGRASDGDAKWVEDWARRKGISCHIGVREGGNLSEESLRRDRLHFLSLVRERTACDAIVLAHHADDQLETILMRLIRGTGVAGLRGIRRARGKFLRPLLHITREELENFAQTEKIRHREDQSNRSRQYLRNRVRQDVVPVLVREAAHFGTKKQFLDRLAHLSEEAEALVQLQKRAARRFYKRNLVTTPLWLRLSYPGFVAQAASDQAFFLRDLLAKVGAEVPSRRKLGEALRDLNTGRKAVEFEGGARVFRSCDYLFFQGKKERTLEKKPLTLQLSNKGLELPELGLRCRVSPSLVTGCEVRFFRAGDSFRGKKLKERFLEERIPRPERLMLPLLVSKKTGETVWYLSKHESTEVQLQRCEFPFSFLESA